MLLTPWAREISAFVTLDAFLQYTVMQFGIRNALVTFQRHVNTVLSVVDGCEAYLDGIFIYSGSWVEHLKTLYNQGMVGYYRNFCKNFSSVVAPLADLLSPKVRFCWTDDCQHSLVCIKALMLHASVLAAPAFDRQFKVAVDATQ